MKSHFWLAHHKKKVVAKLYIPKIESYCGFPWSHFISCGFNFGQSLWDKVWWCRVHALHHQAKRRKQKHQSLCQEPFGFMFCPKIKHNSFVVLTSIKVTTNSLVPPSSLSLKTISTKISPFPPPWRREVKWASWLPSTLFLWLTNFIFPTCVHLPLLPPLQ